MAGWREPRAVRPRRVNDESRSDGWSSNTTRLEWLTAWCLEVIITIMRAFVLREPESFWWW